MCYPSYMCISSGGGGSQDNSALLCHAGACLQAATITCSGLVIIGEGPADHLFKERLVSLAQDRFQLSREWLMLAMIGLLLRVLNFNSFERVKQRFLYGICMH